MDLPESRMSSQLNRGMPKESHTDLYRAKYGLPLDNETHERYIATKVPVRKNKDYRARFRGFSFGFPVKFFINNSFIDLQKR
jgi:hypothetical protein